MMIADPSAAMNDPTMLLVAAAALELRGLRLLRVTPTELDPAQCAEVRAVLVDAGDVEVAAQICRRVRQHPVPAVYLAPLFLLEREAGALPRAIAGMADGSCTPDAFPVVYQQQFAERVATINGHIAQLADNRQARDTNPAFRFLRYMFVRSGHIAPVHDDRHLSGYYYAEFEAFLSKHDENVFEILEFLEGQRLLNSEFVDRVHLCVSCHSASLNFRETCPHCHSANLRVDDLIHHFRCAHVGPLNDFRRGARLVCPKCERELRDVGVDYDKPSAVYVCRDCRHTTQDPETGTLCYRCGAMAQPERLDRLTVKRYSLTGLAENAARHGLDNLFRTVLETELDVLPLQAFKRFVGLEIERIRRYRTARSCLAMLLIEDIDRIYMQAGARAKDIFGELGRIIGASLRPSDVISAYNESLFMILATETPLAGTELMGGRLRERLVTLIKSNFALDPKVRFRGREIDGSGSADSLIDALVNQADKS
jgi:hypothetical protein